MCYFHVQILKRSWNREKNCSWMCERNTIAEKWHDEAQQWQSGRSVSKMDKYGWWSSVCTICTPISSTMVLGFQTWFLLACSTIRIWGAFFFSFPLLHFVRLPLFLLLGKEICSKIQFFLWSSVQVLLRRWRSLQLWWSAISVVYRRGEEVSPWTSAAWLGLKKVHFGFKKLLLFGVSTLDPCYILVLYIMCFYCFFIEKASFCDFQTPWQLLWRMIPRFENAEQAACFASLVISRSQVIW